MYAHFTSRQDAEAIVASGVLFPCSYISGVYAVEVGVSIAAPEVQLSALGRTSVRDFAVVFTTNVTPDASPFGEEVVFNTDMPLPLTDAMVVPAAEVLATLTDPGDWVMPEGW